MRLRLILFDIDGTLVDSQGAILSAMASAFSGFGLPAPDRETALGLVGLSLDKAMAWLVPDLSDADRKALVDAYRAAFAAGRRSGAPSPLYPGVAEGITRLAEQPERLLGVATGKSRRGLEAVLSGHALERHFVTCQTADDHPSKPHPSMILKAMAETGTEAGDTVMIGDTSFDMDMARAAGVAGIGVTWGYHDATTLSAQRVATSFEHLLDLIEDWEAGTA